MSLEFLDTSDNPRLAIFSELLDIIEAPNTDPRTFFQTVAGLMRRAFRKRCYVEVSTAQLPEGSYQITRIWREDGSDAVPDRSPWLTAGVPIRTGGVIAEILATKKPVAVNCLKVPPDDPVFPELGGYRAVAAAPGAGARQKWALLFEIEEDSFNSEDLAALMLRIHLVGSAIKNLEMLGELRRATALIQSEFDRIAEIQRDLIPPPPVNVPGLQIAASWETFDRAGGDAYDYAALADGKWAFLISDVSGHGPAAAVVSAMLTAILHTLPTVGALSPGEVLSFANAQLAAKRIDQSFVTAFLCIWSPHERTITYARAGHNPPLLRRGNQITLLNAVGEIPLAVLDQTVYGDHQQSLEEGDVLVLFTDGIVEAFNPAGDMFGDDRLAKALLASDGSADEILASLRAAQHEFVAGSRSRDDATMLVFKVLER